MDKKRKRIKREAREEDFLFSYNLARPPSRRMDPNPIDRLKWKLFEKGSEKLNPNQKYEPLSYDKIKSALLQIRVHIQKTSCIESQIFKDKGFRIFLKKENQITDSVKARGIVYTLLQLSEKQKCNGVVAISMGSFAHSLCFYARKLLIPKKKKEEKGKIPVTVVMPTSASDNLKGACENLGATIICNDIQDMTQAHNKALRIAKRKGLVYIDSNDHPNMIIGQATLGIEILEDMPNADAIILPTAVDGCGLTAGLAMVIKEMDPQIKVIVVRSSFFDPLIDNIREQTNSLDELEVPVTKHVWYNCGRYLPDYWIDTTVTVNHTLVLNAFEFLKRTQNIFDFGATISLAGILSGELDELKGKRVVIPLFGELEWCLRINNQNLKSRASPSNA